MLERHSAPELCSNPFLFYIETLFLIEKIVLKPENHPDLDFQVARITGSAIMTG